MKINIAQFLITACLSLTSVAILLPLSAIAQGIIREAPKDVKRARMVVTAPPEITLNGTPERLSPGSRIRDINNMLLLSGSVVGQTLPVVYRRDPVGLVHEVWVLTPEEYSKLGGDGDGDGNGYRRFMELLGLIFGARR